MDLKPSALLDHRNALEALPPRDSLDKGVEHSEDFFCRNTEKLPPEDLDLERQCTGPGDTTPAWWRRIWGRILSLIFKTEASAALSRADSNLSSPPNTRVHSIQPTIETVETNLVEPEATYTAGLTRAKPDSESIRTVKETISVRSSQPQPPPPPDTHDPYLDGLLDDRELAASSGADTLEDPRQDGLLNRSQLDDLISFIESAGCIPPRVSSSDKSTARERDSTTIPPYMYQPHSDLLRISPFTEGVCIADADLRRKTPEKWFSENAARATTWLQEHGFGCRPVVPVGCGWYCLFDLNEETITGLIEAGTCKPFNENNTKLPFLDYLKVQQGLEVKTVQLMELRLCLSLFCRYAKEIDPKVLRFRDVLKAETEMELAKEGEAMK
ncbi:hypothetical protein ZTR_09050 [Talaromyces verruculosus]|nr:hypothetical protein ZTR_09050 [Talaromyces verruculosus]